MQEEINEKAIAFVTRKALVTFSPHQRIAILFNGSVVFTETAIIEYEVREGETRRSEIPNVFRIVGMGNGKKLTKSVNVQTNYGIPHAMVELDDADMLALQNNS